MPAYAVTDQVSGQGKVGNIPNFVGELFRLSPLDTPLLSYIGGLTGGKSISSTEFTWQDTIHRAPAIQSVAPGADVASYDAQKRNEKKNVPMIHQYGVEINYTKLAATGQLGSGGDSPTTAATPILGWSSQPVQNEMSWQLQIKVEQAGLDVELEFLTATYANPNDDTARQTQGVIGHVSTDTTVTAGASESLNGDHIDAVSKKLYDMGAPMRNCVIMLGSQEKLDLGAWYQKDASGGWNIAPRSYNRFGVNVTDVETPFGKYSLVLNRHMPADTVLVAELSVLAPVFLPTPGMGHFFIEPLAKSGSYIRNQLYGDIGLELGPDQWHGLITGLNTP